MNKVTYYTLIALLWIIGITWISVWVLWQLDNNQLSNSLAFITQSNTQTYRNYPALDVIKWSKEEVWKFSYLDHMIRVRYINYVGFWAHTPFSQAENYKITFDDKILWKVSIKQSIIRERIESVLANYTYILDFNKDWVVDLKSNDFHNWDGLKFTKSIYTNMDICDSFDNNDNGEIDEWCIIN